MRLKANLSVFRATSCSHFNSTLVRLKVDEDGKVRFNNVDFNSTLVRLKDERFALEWSEVVNFNSTLVRLKAGRYQRMRCSH